MNKRLRPLVLTCLCVALTGCGGSEYKGAKRFALSGKVTYNGEVVDMGTIAFLPLSGEGEQRVSGGGIVDGVYAVPEAQGANAGKYRVEIRWQKKTGKQYRDQLGDLTDERVEAVSAEFHQDSELTAEVSEKQTTFDFDLKSNRPPPRTVVGPPRMPLG